MQEVPVNYLAVLASGVASMVLGSLWYGPMFGKMWMRLSGHTAGSIDEAKKKGMIKVLAHSLEFASEYMDVSGPSAGAMTGFWSWLGFVAPVTMGSVLWDGKPWKLWMLNNGYHLITLVAMGILLAVWN